jgi:hypothetical protein
MKWMSILFARVTILVITSSSWRTRKALTISRRVIIVLVVVAAWGLDVAQEATAHLVVAYLFSCFLSVIRMVVVDPSG